MNGYTLKDGVILLKFETLGGVLAVFGGDVTRGSGHTACLVLGALEDYLYAITFSFLCHSSYCILESYYFDVLVC